MLNLHALHSHVAAGFPALRPPSFWCTDVGDGQLRLHYQSEREGLAPMVVGLVKGLGGVFNTPVTVSHVVPRGSGTHDEFHVTYGDVAEAGRA